MMVVSRFSFHLNMRMPAARVSLSGAPSSNTFVRYPLLLNAAPLVSIEIFTKFLLIATSTSHTPFLGSSSTQFSFVTDPMPFVSEEEIAFLQID